MGIQLHKGGGAGVESGQFPAGGKFWGVLQGDD